MEISQQGKSFNNRKAFVDLRHGSIDKNLWGQLQQQIQQVEKRVKQIIFFFILKPKRHHKSPISLNFQNQNYLQVLSQTYLKN